MVRGAFIGKVGMHWQRRVDGEAFVFKDRGQAGG